MSFQLRSATVRGDALVLVVVTDDDRDVPIVVEGEVSTAWNVTAKGHNAVSFYCKPRSAEPSAKHLNEPPVNF